MRNTTLIAAMMALTSADLIHAPPSRGTVSNPRRFKHFTEAEQEKREAKRKEIAEWNKKVEEAK